MSGRSSRRQSTAAAGLQARRSSRGSHLAAVQRRCWCSAIPRPSVLKGRRCVEDRLSHEGVVSGASMVPPVRAQPQSLSALRWGDSGRPRGPRRPSSPQRRQSQSSFIDCSSSSFPVRLVIRRRGAAASAAPRPPRPSAPDGMVIVATERRLAYQRCCTPSSGSHDLPLLLVRRSS